MANLINCCAFKIGKSDSLQEFYDQFPAFGLHFEIAIAIDNRGANVIANVFADCPPESKAFGKEVIISFLKSTGAEIKQLKRNEPNMISLTDAATVAYLCLSLRPTSITDPENYTFSGMSLPIEVPSNNSNLFQCMQESPEQYSDVDVMAKGPGGRTVAIPALKILLATASPYFKKFFEPRPPVKAQPSVSFHLPKKPSKMQIDESKTDEEVVRDILMFIMGAPVNFDQGLDQFEWIRERYEFAARTLVDSYMLATIKWVSGVKNPDLLFKFVQVLMQDGSETSLRYFEEFLAHLTANKMLISDQVMSPFYERTVKRVAHSNDVLSEQMKAFIRAMVTPTNYLQSWFILRRADAENRNFATKKLKKYQTQTKRSDFARIFMLLDDAERDEVLEALEIGTGR